MRIAIILLAIVLSGCAPLVCHHPPEDYDFCVCHYYNGGFHP